MDVEGGGEAAQIHSILLIPLKMTAQSRPAGAHSAALRHITTIRTISSLRVSQLCTFTLQNSRVWASTRILKADQGPCGGTSIFHQYHISSNYSLSGPDQRGSSLCWATGWHSSFVLSPQVRLGPESLLSSRNQKPLSSTDASTHLHFVWQHLERAKMDGGGGS